MSDHAEHSVHAVEIPADSPKSVHLNTNAPPHQSATPSAAVSPVSAPPAGHKPAPAQAEQQRPVTQRTDAKSPSTRIPTPAFWANMPPKTRFIIVNSTLVLLELFAWIACIVAFGAELQRATVSFTYPSGYNVATGQITYTSGSYTAAAYWSHAETISTGGTQSTSYDQAGTTVQQCAPLGQATVAMYAIAFACCTLLIAATFVRMFVGKFTANAHMAELGLSVGTFLFTLLGVLIWAGCSAKLDDPNVYAAGTGGLPFSTSKMLTGYGYLIFTQIILLFGIPLMYMLHQNAAYHTRAVDKTASEAVAAREVHVVPASVV